MSEQTEALFSRDSERSAPAAQIDRLVSGDLSETERLELLAWLDESPVRWRRCGLAFLEAQALREALAETEPVSRPRTQEKIQRQSRSSAVRVGASAIALLLAFALGWGSHRGVEPAVEKITAEGTGDELPGPIDESPVIAERDDTGDRPQEGLAMLRFSTGSGDQMREFSVPVRFSDGSLEVLDPPDELPEYVRQQWERRGYHVSQQRQTLQLTLANGRQLNVPVDQFLLTYVGQPML